MTNAPDPNTAAGGVAPTTPTASDPAAPPQKSPLDILEEILQQKGGVGEPADAASAAPAAPVVDPAAEEAAKLAEIKALEQQSQAEDQAALAAKQAELASAKQTPAYQARVKQDQATKQQSDSQNAAHEGYQIKQLQHTKIEGLPE